MISIKNLVIYRGSKSILQQANLTIHDGEKVGLIGRNGVGKSTLFSLIAGRLQADGGHVLLPEHCRIAEVDQSITESNVPANQFVMAGDRQLAAANQQLEHAQAHDDTTAMAHAYALLEEAGAYDAQARAEKIILGLGFSPNQLQQPFANFSGGWRMRLQLARALMAPSDLMLLDEPTNHLDIDALIWLEQWLKKYPGTLVVISHDRDFLDAVCTTILHMNNQQQLQKYKGNYSQFEESYAVQLSQQQASHDKQQKTIAHLESFIRRFKAKASKARQAQSRVKALARMEKITSVLAENALNFQFNDPKVVPNPLLSAKNLVCGYHHDQPIVASTVLTIEAGQRIGLLGANGQGKSTLIKTLTGFLQPLAGQIDQANALRIGYFSQHELDVLEENDSPLAHMLALAKQAENAAYHSPEARRELNLRNYLGTFLFDRELAERPVNTLSGGEKARLILAMIAWQQPNLLILDEPTNHLDLLTRQAMALALQGFTGSLLLVSHDRGLLRDVCEQYWLVRDKSVQDFAGDLAEYQRLMLASTKSTTTKTTAKSPTAKIKPKSTQRKISKIEGQIAQLEQEKQQLTQLFTQPLEIEQLNLASQRMKTLEETIAQLESEWFMLVDQN